MAFLFYNEFKRANAAAEIDLNADDIRARLVMSSTTCDTENAGIVAFAGFTTIDKCDSAGYADVALTAEAVNKDDSNNRAEFDADDATWAALASCTRTVIGVVIYKYVDGTDANDIPIAYVGFASAKTPDGSDFVVQWDEEGILQIG